MAGKTAQPTGDDGPPGPGAWIVTFSDCMTLLLCFFVILVTFSSFDDVAHGRIAGAFGCTELDSISQEKHTVLDSVVVPRDRQVDHSVAGSETPTDDPPKSIQNPREPLDTASVDAYRDKRVFRIPSRRLFWGNGCRFVHTGRDHLHMIASFMKMVPCRVVVGEIPSPEERRLSAQAALSRGLERSWAVVEYFAAEEHLPADRFHLSAAPAAPPDGLGPQPVMEITLLARDVHK